MMDIMTVLHLRKERERVKERMLLSAASLNEIIVCKHGTMNF